MKKYFTSIDLFAGPGGLCTGFDWAGIKPLIAVEWSYWTVQTYAISHNADIFVLDEYLNNTMNSPEKFFKPCEKTVLIYGDINKVENDLILKLLNERFEVNGVDIVTGGAPCESFSMAGDRKEDDNRNILYKNILRIARASNAKMFMFENVKGLFSKKLDGHIGQMYKEICKDFESSPKNKPKYKLASKDKSVVLLKASDYGVPQARERLFLVGINKLYRKAKFNYPTKTHGYDQSYPYVSVEKAILDLPVIESGQENNTYNLDISSVQDETQSLFLSFMRGEKSQIPKHINFKHTTLSGHKAPGHTHKMMTRISLIKQGENMKTAFQRLLSEGKEDIAKACFPNKIYAARNRRLNPNEPSFTVTSHCLDEMVHPIQNRGLTPREVARLQSFPDWYQFQGPYVKFHSDPEQDQYEQIGDAIPPLLAYALGKEVYNTLQQIAEDESNE